MTLDRIDGAMLRKMILSGVALLEQNKQGVDALNVFPVPDGDTGTNMTMTMQSAAREVQHVPSDALEDVAKALSKGALKGARGNSGVILSQLFRGFAQRMQGLEFLSPQDFADCFQAASDMAYKALMKPKEGTILTVARVIGESAQAAARQGADIIEIMRQALAGGEEVLKRTPDMLPVLKQAGVVDAGGKGLLYVCAGYYQALTGQQAEVAWQDDAPEDTVAESVADIENLEDIRFGYCTELYIIHIKDGVGPAEIEALRQMYDSFGDSVLVVSDGDLIKVHCHSETPWKVLQYAQELGEINGVKIDNMRQQNRDLLAQRAAQRAPKKPISMVSVAAGEGLKALFGDLLSDEVIFGGQTMNPSIEDIAKAIMASGGENVIVLPNNSNIILAAQQAAQVVEGRNVCVIPTKSMTAGIAAALAYNPEHTLEENQKQMTEAFAHVRDGQVTYAVRDTTVNDVAVRQGDIIGLADGKLVADGSVVEDVVMDLLGHMVDAEHELITLYFGEDVTEEAAEALSQRIGGQYPRCDVEVVCGGQPLYYYFISVE
nr:DAK2 domain-containing protein [bacterium]